MDQATTVHMRQPAATDARTFASPTLTREERDAAEKNRLEKRQSFLHVDATFGDYNVGGSIKEYNRFKTDEFNQPITKIPQLSDQIYRLIKKIVKLGINDHVSGEQVQDEAVNNYIAKAIQKARLTQFGMPSLVMEVGKILQETGEIELDLVKLEEIISSSDHEQRMKQLALGWNEEEDQRLYVDLKAAMDVRKRGGIGVIGKFAVAATTDEVEIQLDNMRRELRDQGEHNAHRMFLFNNYREAHMLAERAFGKHKRKSVRNKVEKFRIGQITLKELNKGFDAQINNMVEQKYASLAKYFQDGNSMETLYTDYFFDGEMFLNQHPFMNAGSGFIRTINFQARFLQITDSVAKANDERLHRFHFEAERIRTSAKCIKNPASFLRAIAEGDQATKELKSILLTNNVLSSDDYHALSELLVKSQIERLDLCGAIITISDNSAEEEWLTLAEALQTCHRLKFVNFSDLQYKTDTGSPEPLTDGMCENLLRSLHGSHETLTEIKMSFTLPDCRGRAGEKSGDIILGHVSTMPNLLSFDFSGHSLTVTAVQEIVKAVLASTKIKYGKLRDIKHTVPVAHDPLCLCCEPFCTMYALLEKLCWKKVCYREDTEVTLEPAPMVLNQLATKTKENRDAEWPQAINTVVVTMLEKYRESLGRNANQRLDEWMEAEIRRRNAVQNDEEGAHNVQVDLNRAGAATTNITTRVSVAAGGAAASSPQNGGPYGEAPAPSPQNGGPYGGAAAPSPQNGGPYGGAAAGGAPAPSSQEAGPLPHKNGGQDTPNPTAPVHDHGAPPPYPGNLDDVPIPDADGPVPTEQNED